MCDSLQHLRAPRADPLISAAREPVHSPESRSHLAAPHKALSSLAEEDVPTCRLHPSTTTPRPQQQDWNECQLYLGTPRLNPAAAVEVLRCHAPFGSSKHSNSVSESRSFASINVSELFARPGDIGLSVKPLAHGHAPSTCRPSWCDMLVMQPPPTAMDVKVSWRYNEKGPWDDYLEPDADDEEDAETQFDDNERYLTPYASAYNPQGITFGDLQDIAALFCEQRLAYPVGAGELDHFRITVMNSTGRNGIKTSEIIKACHDREAENDNLCDCLQTMFCPEEVAAEEAQVVDTDEQEV